MSEFQFAKTQRVIVPADRAGAEGVQGVVTVNVARLGREPHYEVQWPCCGIVGEKGDLTMLCTDVSESDLIKAQPPKMIALEEAQRQIGIECEKERERCTAEYRAAMAHVARLEAAAKRRRKASRAVSRKRR